MTFMKLARLLQEIFELTRDNKSLSVRETVYRKQQKKTGQARPGRLELKISIVFAISVRIISFIQPTLTQDISI